MKPAHWAVLAVAVLLAGWAGWQVIGPGRTGGFNAPPKQPQPDDDLAWYTHNPHPDYPLFCPPEQHHAGYTYTPHRYPRVTGGEITALIHRGYSPMRVPSVRDVQWMIAPPSEVIT